jgi:hypothetical protein
MSFARTLFGLLLMALPAARAAELKTLKGDVIKGDLVSVSAKEVVLDVAGKRVTTPNDQVLTLTLTEEYEKLGPEVKYALVELTDGTQLKVASYQIKKADAKLTLLHGQVVDLPLAKVNWVLNEAHDARNLKDFKEKVLARKKSYDMLALKTKDVVNVVEGTIGEADEKGENIEFVQKGGTKREVPLDGPLAYYFQRTPDPTAKPVVCRINDTARNLLYASDVEKTAEGVTVVCSSGITIKYPTDRLARLDYSTGKLAYLVQLPPAAMIKTLVGGTEADKDFIHETTRAASETIKLGGTEYKNVLALHATTEVVYNLEGEYRELKAVVGSDEEAVGDDEPTVLKVIGDDAELINWTFTAKDKEKVRTLNVNVKDVQKLKIVVTTGGVLDLGKHLILAEARVSK